MYSTLVSAALFALAVASMHALTQPRSLSSHEQNSRAVQSLIEVNQIVEAIETSTNGVVVLDVRTTEEYEAGHWPDAIQVSYDQWEELSLDAQTGLTHEQAWREQIGSLGIDGNDTVLVYDNGKMTHAARVWFVLQHFGVAHAAVVNGGFPLLQAHAAQGSLELSTKSHEPTPTELLPEPGQAGRIANMDRFEVKAAIERGGAQVLDARTVEEYRGIDLRKNDRGGHLPTAQNIPHTRMLDEQGRLRPVDELADLLDQAGFVKGRPVITHCDGGGRAALAALAAARAGYGPVMNYYLSFGDWAKDATCPIVTPE